VKRTEQVNDITKQAAHWLEKDKAKGRFPTDKINDLAKYAGGGMKMALVTVKKEPNFREWSTAEEYREDWVELAKDTLEQWRAFWSEVAHARDARTAGFEKLSADERAKKEEREVAQATRAVGSPRPARRATAGSEGGQSSDPLELHEV
jgi:hypothetical protein